MQGERTHHSNQEALYSLLSLVQDQDQDQVQDQDQDQDQGGLALMAPYQSTILYLNMGIFQKNPQLINSFKNRPSHKLIPKIDL